MEDKTLRITAITIGVAALVGMTAQQMLINMKSREIETLRIHRTALRNIASGMIPHIKSSSFDAVDALLEQERKFQEITLNNI